MTERDDATGLDHTGWRKYESTSGRWTSPDPRGGTLNAYSYSGNDPVNLVDPSGLMPCEPGNYSAECGFSGWGGGYWGGNGWGMDPHPGQRIIREAEQAWDWVLLGPWHHRRGEGFSRNSWMSDFDSEEFDPPNPATKQPDGEACD